MAVPLDFGCLGIDARGLVLSDPTKSDRSAPTGILNGTSTGLRTESSYRGRGGVLGDIRPLQSSLTLL